MTENEKNTFLRLCGYLNESEEDLREVIKENATPEVLGHLFFNRMQGIAYHTLLKSGLAGEVNREFRNSLKCAWEQNCIKNESFYKAIELLKEILFGKENKYAMLKGAILCGEYPEGCRTSNDVDLLILPKDITEIGKALTDAGFRQGEIKNGEFVPASRKEIIASRMTRGETVPYILDIGLPMMRYFEVDLNFSLDYKNSETDALTEMLNRTELRTVHGIEIPTLCKEDFFIHLCGHLYKEAMTLPWIRMKRDMSLYKYADIYMLLNGMDESDIDRIFARAKKFDMDKICAFAVLQTSELFEVNDYAALAAVRALGESKDILDLVVAPQEKSMLRYTVRSAKQRFFSRDRVNFLKKVM